MVRTGFRPLHCLRPLLAIGFFAISLAGCASKPAATETLKGSYAFWPQAPNLPHIQYLTSLNRASDVRMKQSKMDALIYGKSTEADMEITKPFGMAIWNGRIYVCDIRGAGVAVLDVKGRQARLMGSSGSGTIKRAVDVVAAPDGTKYVADNGRNAVLAFDANERFIQLYTHADFNPVSVAVWGDELFVCDMKGKTVKVLDRRSGEILRTIGKSHDAGGEFVWPTAVAFDLEGNLLVVDTLQCQVLRFSRDGKLLGKFGSMGNRPGDFARPKHLKVSKNNIIYVVDAQFNNVQMLDNEGKAMMFFGAAGGHPGAMFLPAGLCISEDPADLELFKDYIHPAFEAHRLVLVSNQLGANRIAVYAEGQLKPGKTLADLAPNRADVTADTESAKTAATQPTTKPAAE